MRCPAELAPDGTAAFRRGVVKCASQIPVAAMIAAAFFHLAMVVGSAPIGVAINPAGTFAYVTNEIGNSVSVINTATNAIAATIPVGSMPNGIVINPAGTLAYVANSLSNTVSVINTATNVVVATASAGTLPYGIAINPAATFLYVTNGGNSVSVINTATNLLVATVTVGVNPAGIAINPAGTFAYVAINAGNTVSVIDTATNIMSGQCAPRTSGMSPMAPNWTVKIVAFVALLRINQVPSR